MSERSAGHLLVAQLEQQGVERVYCVPGESYLDVLDGLHDSPIRTVVCRQEGGAAFMAMAEGRLTKRPGVAMVTRGPGAANAAVAVDTARKDATPLVLFVGMVPLHDRWRGSFQEFDLHSWFGAMAKRVTSLDVPGRAAAVVAEAFHVASSGRPGPVVVGLPEDVLVAPADGAGLPVRAVGDGAVSPVQADRLLELLGEARRPLVVVGGDRWDSASAARLTRWCEQWRLPVATDFRAHDIVDHDCPSYVGWLGFGCDPALHDLVDSADLLLLVGCGAGDVLTGGYVRGRAAERVVVVDTDPELVEHGLRLDLHLLASPAALSDAVAAREPAQTPPWAEWTERAHGRQQRFGTPAPDGGRGGVDLGVAMELLRQRLDPDAVVTYGAGNYAVWPQRYLPHHQYPSVLAPRNGTMGFGVPAGVAASLACPGRQVVTLTGDGDFLMNGQELATAVAHGAGPLVLVVDNGMYGTIRAHQQRAYPGRYTGTSLVNPDFAAYCRSFGGHGERVTRTEDLAAALDRAMEVDGLALLHLVVDPDVLRPRPQPPG